MATIGLPKSDSVIPVARHNARAPAILRPWVVVRERSAGIGSFLGLINPTSLRQRPRQRRVVTASLA